MITVVTGTPGAGKTLHVVGLVVSDLSKRTRADGSSRPVFHNIEGFLEGVNNVELEHVRHGGDDLATTWMDLPDGSIIILDEVQRQWPASYDRKVLPEFLQHLDTHRHRGFDFWIITQHPKLIAPIARRLASAHTHLTRPFGAKYSKLHRWQAVNDDPPVPVGADQTDVQRVRFDPKLFALYRSASEHTMRFKLPGNYVRALAIVVVGIGVFGWFAYDAAMRFFRPDPGEEVADTLTESPASGPIVVAATCIPLTGTTPPVVRLRGALAILPDDAPIMAVGGRPHWCPPPQAYIAPDDNEVLQEAPI